MVADFLLSATTRAQDRQTPQIDHCKSATGLGSQLHLPASQPAPQKIHHPKVNGGADGTTHQLVARGKDNPLATASIVSCFCVHVNGGIPMKSMSIEEFYNFISGFHASKYLYHYAEQKHELRKPYLKASITFDVVDVLTDCDAIRFSSENGYMIADHVERIMIHDDAPFGTTMVIACYTGQKQKCLQEIVISAT